jgi:AraC family transcriptional regulator of adaptative response / DNA-3-methyladenine glycosylase II
MSCFSRRIGYHSTTNDMDLDWRICSRARLARDARFDGKFFIGILSTRIYCRPICRARTSKESNVLYFRSAAAAAEAGFRPCLRCRPECSPLSLAWAGTRNTVSRALRLITENGLDEGGVEVLAERLGVTSRHLRRLFMRHLGASPGAVAQTVRLHFAKKLIDETKLPMMEVALASGFGCVRRFNERIRNVYHRTPTQIRALVRRTAIQPENEYFFHLDFRPPFNWERILQYLASRAIPGVESVEGGSYRRSISFNGNHGRFDVSLDSEKNALAVRLHFSDPRSLFSIVERIRAMFDLNSDWAVIARTLRADPALAPLVETEQGIRVPGCWNAFELTTQGILGQHTSLERATSLTAQMVSTFGQRFTALGSPSHLFPTPEALANADLARVGLYGVKAEAIRTFVRAVCDGRIKFDGIIDCDAFLKQLCEVPGIDRRTGQYVAMRALRDPDAFLADDLVLRRIAGVRTIRELERRSEAWRPWRAYAAMLLWQSAGNARTEIQTLRSRPCTSPRLGSTQARLEIEACAKPSPINSKAMRSQRSGSV